MPDVVSMGIIVADHISQVLDRLPEAGELIAIDDPILTIGGCAANVAVDLVKLGIDVSVIGVVGDDGFGAFLIDELGRHGVQTARIRKTTEFTTSQTIILPVRGQDRRFIHSFGANQALGPEDLNPRQLAGTRVLYVGGYFLLPRLNQAALAPLFQHAQQRGIQTVLDVVTPGPRDYLKEVDQILRYTDVFVPNDDESRLITGRSDPLQQAEVFRRLGARTVVITCGEQGALLLCDQGAYRFGVYPTHYVDGTGSGDAFTAGYIYGLLKNLGPVDCVRYASALGASCVRGLGTTAATFTRDELERFVATEQIPCQRVAGSG